MHTFTVASRRDNSVLGRLLGLTNSVSSEGLQQSALSDGLVRRPSHHAVDPLPQDVAAALLLSRLFGHGSQIAVVGVRRAQEANPKPAHMMTEIASHEGAVSLFSLPPPAPVGLFFSQNLLSL